MQQYIFEIPYREPEKAFSIFAEEDGCVFLDSNDSKSPHSNFSFIGFSPLEKITRHGDKTEISNQEFSLNFYNNPFDIIANRLDTWKQSIRLAARPPLPFTNGAIGFFAYELARVIEKLPPSAQDMMGTPDLALGIYDQVIGFDLKKKKSWFCTIAANEKTAQARLSVLNARLNNFKYTLPNSSRPEWQRLKTRDEYKSDIQTVINYIHAGDIFQVNLTQTFLADKPDYFDSYAHYLQLRNINPAPFSSYFRMADVTLSSSSPERFLKVANGKVETRPIKGTVSDDQSPATLKASVKDRAENTMIVDLLRNDLSKVCKPDSINVPQLCEVESYSGLHHLVSTVTGDLKDNASAISVLAACFPGGSITGAPKIRAMEIIDELEPVRRGAYCGAMGYIGFDGAMDMNITIRTLVYKGDKISLSVGGGIVADSDMEAEYQETLVKARKIFESFDVNTRTADQPAEKIA